MNRTRRHVSPRWQAAATRATGPVTYVRATTRTGNAGRLSNAQVYGSQYPPGVIGQTVIGTFPTIVVDGTYICTLTIPGYYKYLWLSHPVQETNAAELAFFDASDRQILYQGLLQTPPYGVPGQFDAPLAYDGNPATFYASPTLPGLVGQTSEPGGALRTMPSDWWGAPIGP